MSINATPTRIFALGGIGEIGKNCYIVEHDDEIFITDCGVKFCDETMPGVSGIIVPFDYLIANKSKIKGLFITHAHDDHIGGIPYLVAAIPNLKIYTAKYTTVIVKNKISQFPDAVKNTPVFEMFDDNWTFQTKNFKVEVFRVCHSTPDGFGIYFETVNGKIMLTGDYRFDFEAVSDKTDITKIAQLGQKNIDLLLTETTNSERKGFSPSEVNVVAEIGRIVKNAKGRVFVSLFASNISRANELLEIAVKNNRKIVLLGRSMINNINASMEIKYVNVEKTDFVEDLDSIHNIPEDKIFVLMTGSQGEELAALNQIVNGTNKYFAFKPADTVVFSSSPIVGNYKNVENLINKLHKTRAKIIINSSKHPTHASGHATQQEQQLMVSLINPKYLLPVHGEIKMQHAFEKTAVSMGQAQNNILIVTNGQVVELLNHVAKVTNEIIPTFEVYIDGKTINDSTDILKYRKVLSTDGICGVTLIYNKETKKIINFPVFAIRGSFYVKTSIPLVEKMSKEIVATFDKEVSSNPSLNINNDYFSNLVKNVVWNYVWETFKKRPWINTTVFSI